MLRRLIILALFAALVVVLLWFQGILFRHEPATTDVPEAPRLAADVHTAHVERRALSDERVLPGFVEAVDPAPVAARVMATIVELTVREGDRVAQDQVLARLDDRDARTRLQQAEAALSAADAQALAARLGFERVERLLAAEAATTADWESARAAHEGAKAQRERAAAGVEEARTALSWFTVTAPFGGVVHARWADPGQLASPGQPLLELYAPETLRVAVAVPDEQAQGLEPGSELSLAFDGVPDRRATLTRVLPAADRQSGTVTLHLAPADVTDLRPGQLARLVLGVGERPALVVPAAAVERIGQIERVRQVRDDHVFPQTVKTGKRHGDWVEVLSGLAEGDEVVVP